MKKGKELGLNFVRKIEELEIKMEAIILNHGMSDYDKYDEFAKLIQAFNSRKGKE